MLVRWDVEVCYCIEKVFFGLAKLGPIKGGVMDGLRVLIWRSRVPLVEVCSDLVMYFHGVGEQCALVKLECVKIDEWSSFP